MAQLESIEEVSGRDTTLGTCLALEMDDVIRNSGGAKTLKFEGLLQEIPCLQFPVTIGSVSFLIDVLVFDTGNLDLILGMAWLSSLGEVTHDWHNAWMQFQFKGNSVRLQGISPTQAPSAALQQWLGRLESCEADVADLVAAEVFAAPRGLPPPRVHDHVIQLKSENPICVRPYHYPHFQKTEIERQVTELLSLGMIRPSKSAYSSPVILVRKKDNSWCMCVDYRALNDATIPDKYPMFGSISVLFCCGSAMHLGSLDSMGGILFVPGEVRVEKVAQDLKDRDEALRKLKLHLSNAQSSMKEQEDKTRRDVHFTIGEWVYVKIYLQICNRERVIHSCQSLF
ncbi:hypothetical protein E3N88_17125 [Mikania micrantha]|uniref:Reverse transcriptase domain-containing protein n=1 Tax=Mikania micrantha TaxID=192012 RepID=A0A5N6NSC4_9ASTR|nr:hypothetical protein E3N88_17125 [Mikania micrantha]